MPSRGRSGEHSSTRRSSPAAAPIDSRTVAPAFATTDRYALFAHDLVQPLAAILANAQTAARMLDQGRLSGDELRHILNEIVADVERATDIIAAPDRWAHPSPPGGCGEQC